jgi:hypothetical protein
VLVDIALMVLGLTMFPVAGLALLLWLTHLEETLPRDVRSTLRSRTPPPVLAVPLRQPEPAGVLTVVRDEGAERAGADFSRPARPARPADAVARPARAAG